MIGVDGSEEMLMEAREKMGDADILYLCQDMREFELYGTVRAVVSTCDTMNYLLTRSDFIQTVRLVNNYLDPGGLFILVYKNGLTGSFSVSINIFDKWIMGRIYL